jgi:hypothetical protein
MGLINVHSFVAGNWLPADDGARPIASAVTGEPLAIAGQASLDTQSMIDYARLKGGPALRAMTFHDRARMLKALALELGKFKDELYALSYTTGATKPDSMIDIDGGIGTMLVYASKGRREMPDGHIYVDGELEMLSRNGSFVGQHVATSLQGVAVHINAFNFPGLGHAREARADTARRHAGNRQAGHGHLPRHRAMRPPHDRERHPARGCGAARLGRPGRSARPARLPGRGRLHRLGQDRPDAAFQSAFLAKTPSASSPSRTASTPPCLAPTSRRAAPNSTSSSRKLCAR